MFQFVVLLFTKWPPRHHAHRHSGGQIREERHQGHRQNDQGVLAASAQETPVLLIFWRKILEDLGTQKKIQYYIVLIVQCKKTIDCELLFGKGSTVCFFAKVNLVNIPAKNAPLEQNLVNISQQISRKNSQKSTNKIHLQHLEVSVWFGPRRHPPDLLCTGPRAQKPLPDP